MTWTPSLVGAPASSNHAWPSTDRPELPVGQVLFMEGMMSTSLYFVTEGEVEVFSMTDNAAVDFEGSQQDRRASADGIATNEPNGLSAANVNAAASDASKDKDPKDPKAPPPATVETAKAAKATTEHKQKTAAELNAELGIVGTAKPKPVEAPEEPEQSNDTPGPDEEEKILGTYPYGGTFGEAAFVFQIYHPYSLRARWTNDVKALMLSLADYDRILETHPQVVIGQCLALSPR